MNTYLILFLVFSLLSFFAFLWLDIVAFKRGVGWGLAVLLLSPITAIVFSLVNWYEARKAFILYITTFLLSFGSLIFIYSQVGLGNMREISAKMQRGELAPAQAYQLLSRAMQGQRADLFATPVTTKQQLAGDGMKKQITATAKPVNVDASTPVPPGAKPASTAVNPASSKNQIAVADKPGPKPATAKPATLASTTKTNAPPAEKKKALDPVNEDPSIPPNINMVPKDPLAQHSKPPSDKVTVSLDRISHYIGRSFLITMRNGTTHHGILRKVTRTRLELDIQAYGGSFVYRVNKDQIRKIQMYKRIRMD